MWSCSLTLVKNEAIRTEEQVSLQCAAFGSFPCGLRVSTAESHRCFSFSYLKELISMAVAEVCMPDIKKVKWHSSYRYFSKC